VQVFVNSVVYHIVVVVVCFYASIDVITIIIFFSISISIVVIMIIISIIVVDIINKI
jgi:hypothetical protein